MVTTKFSGNRPHSITVVSLIEQLPRQVSSTSFNQLFAAAAGQAPSGHFAKAMSICKEIDKYAPESPELLGLMGAIYQATGDIKSAIRLLEKTLAIDPVNHTALSNLGLALKEQGNFTSALASTLKSLELKPDNPTAHMNLGGIYKDLGQFDQALTSTLKSPEQRREGPEGRSRR